MKILLMITAFMALASGSIGSQEKEFQDWKESFGKTYTSDQEEYHNIAWLKNLKLVQDHNKLADQGMKSYRLGMTYFADMDNQEYRESVVKGCLQINRSSKANAATFFQQSGRTDLPESVNWTANGYVTEVKNQKDCNSCWAFSATGALEGQIFKNTGKLVPLSTQQLVDCSGTFGNEGCHGGSMELAFEYVKENGLATEESYPYEAKDGECRFNKTTVGAACTGYEYINEDDEDDLKEAVATIGPISAAINSNYSTFHLYISGVYDEPGCSTEVDHGVLVVGYGTENGKDYWLVKNSWGTDWGESGYIKMSRNKHNQCGIATSALYPLVPNKTQHVQCEACSTVFVLVCLLFGMFY